MIRHRARGLPARSATVLLAALAVTGLTGLGGAGAAAALTARPSWQNGGCHSDTDGGPFKASACISAQTIGAGRATRVVYNSDAYIDVKPSGCFQLEIDVYDHNGQRISQGGWQRFCGKGRYLGPSQQPWPGGAAPIYSELTIVDGSKAWVMDSYYLG
ncbi:MAG TPA: hypothetical protein VI248_23820 [Kineosporiaceae bacterium]